MTKYVFNISELSNNHKVLELCGFELPRFLCRKKKKKKKRKEKEKLSAVIAILQSGVDKQILACCKFTFKMGQSVTLKSKSLLHILYLGHILGTLGHFIGIHRITGWKR